MGLLVPFLDSCPSLGRSPPEVTNTNLFPQVMLVVSDTTYVRQILTDTKNFIKGSDYSTKVGMSGHK